MINYTIIYLTLVAVCAIPAARLLFDVLRFGLLMQRINIMRQSYLFQLLDLDYINIELQGEIDLLNEKVARIRSYHSGWSLKMKQNIALGISLVCMAGFLVYDYESGDDSVIIPVEEVHYKPCEAKGDKCTVK